MKDKIYETIEEARKEAKRRLENAYPKMFCPLINGKCNKDCAAIGYPYARKTHKDMEPVFVVNDFYCTAYAIMGPQ